MPGGYIYLQLAEAVERIGAAVNIWAVVAESSVPRATRGTGARVPGRNLRRCRRRRRQLRAPAFRSASCCLRLPTLWWPHSS